MGGGGAFSVVITEDKMDFDAWLGSLLKSMLDNSHNIEWMREESQKELEECYKRDGAAAAERRLVEMVEAGDVQGF